jgi:tetratricopeptide (TPR) repeat protein
MNNILKHRYTIGAVVIVALAIGVFSFREEVGIKIWEMVHMPQLSLLLNPSAELAFSIGDYYFNTGEYADGTYDLELAEEYFKRTLRYDDSFPWALYQLARIAFLDGDFNVALSRIDTHMQHFSDGYDQVFILKGYYTRGLILGYMGRLDESAEQFSKLVEINREIEEESWAAYNDLAWVYFLKGDYEHVFTVTQEGLSFYPDNPWLLNMLGISQLNLGIKEDARESLEKSLKATKELTSDDWAEAYPGNNPKVAPYAFSEMIKAIETNLELVAE